MLRFAGTITLPAGLPRNNTNSGVATLDLSGHAARLNSKLRMIAPGVGGNAWTFSSAGDSAGGAGISIVVDPVGKTIALHYETGVSTVALFEAAVAALSGANAVFAIDAPGTPSNVLANAGDAFAATAFAGGAAGAFALSATAKKVHLLTAAADVVFEVACDGRNPSPMATSSGTGLALAANTEREALAGNGSPPVVCLLSTGGTTVKVWQEA